MSIFTRTLKWFQTAGQITDPPAPNPRQLAFYTGMQCEELSEKLTALQIDASELRELADSLKKGALDARFIGLCAATQQELLDADLDITWVTIGSMAAQGADAEGAWNEVARANWDKFPGGIATRHPETGKVIKPEGWRAPNLAPFLHGGVK
jgi:predicted HAD superfamily Cof-like phosphohydrolase